MFTVYKANKNFRHYKQVVKELVYSLFKNSNMSLINNRLYIKYYDIINFKEIIVSNFKNRKHLVKCLLRSAHIPFITSKKFILDHRYIDGIYPYIFKTPERNLFIQLFSFIDPFNIVYVKNETTILPRIIYGANQANNFFKYGYSSACNIIYSNDCYFNLHFLIRLISAIIIIFNIYFIRLIIGHIPYESTKTLTYTLSKNIICQLLNFTIDSIV